MVIFSLSEPQAEGDTYMADANSRTKPTMNTKHANPAQDYAVHEMDEQAIVPYPLARAS